MKLRRSKTLSFYFCDDIGIELKKPLFKDGYAKVKRKDNQYNLISSCMRLWSKEWYDSIANDFSDGFARCWRDNKVTLVDRSGERINDDWYNRVSQFHSEWGEECALVNKDNHENILHISGRLLSNTWDLKYFTVNAKRILKLGLIEVEKDKFNNFMRSDGSFVFKKWYKILSYNAYYLIVLLGGESFVIDWNENEVSPHYGASFSVNFWNQFSHNEECIVISDPNTGLYIYNCQTNRYLIEPENYATWRGVEERGDILIYGTCFDSNDLRVTRENIGLSKTVAWRGIKTDGTYFSKYSFKDIFSFSNGVAIVNYEGTKRYISDAGEFIGNEWDFQSIYPFSCGLGRVQLYDNFNYIKRDGTFLFSHWLNEAYDFVNGAAIVRFGSKYYFIDVEGNELKHIPRFEKFYRNSKDYLHNYGLICYAIEFEDNNYALVFPNNNYYLAGPFLPSERKAIDFLSYNSWEAIQVTTSNGINFISNEGKFLSHIWLKHVKKQQGEYLLYSVQAFNGLWNLYSMKGVPIFDKWGEKYNIGKYTALFYDNIWHVINHKHFGNSQVIMSDSEYKALCDKCES